MRSRYRPFTVRTTFVMSKYDVLKVVLYAALTQIPLLCDRSIRRTNANVSKREMLTVATICYRSVAMSTRTVVRTRMYKLYVRKSKDNFSMNTFAGVSSLV